MPPPAHAPKTGLHMPISEFRSTSRLPQKLRPPHWLQIAGTEKTGTLQPMPSAEPQRTPWQYKKAHILRVLIPDRLPRFEYLPAPPAQKAPPETPIPALCPN